MNTTTIGLDIAKIQLAPTEIVAVMNCWFVATTIDLRRLGLEV